MRSAQRILETLEREVGPGVGGADTSATGASADRRTVGCGDDHADFVISGNVVVGCVPVGGILDEDVVRAIYVEPDNAGSHCVVGNVC